MKTGADIAGLDFEAALAALSEVVEELESGRVPLDRSIALYERGVALRRHCEAKLRDAQARIERIRLAGDGTPGTEPFAPDARAKAAMTDDPQ